jgi:hypothetical protein
MTTIHKLSVGLLCLAVTTTQLIDTVGAKETSKNLLANNSDDGDIVLTGFQCGSLNGKPTTFMHFLSPAKKERKAEFITWTNKYITTTSWNPEKRCNVVSKRLETMRKNSSLSGQLIHTTLPFTNSTTGETETARVVCFTDDPNAEVGKGDCSRLLLTLAPTEDADQVVSSFRKLFGDAASVAPDPLVRGSRVCKEASASDTVDFYCFSSGLKGRIESGSLRTYPVK